MDGGQKRKLKAGVAKLGGPKKQNQNRSQADRVQRMQPAEDQQSEQIDRSHQRRAQNWRAVLDDSDVNAQCRESQQNARSKRKP
jgi:hypothetical protein